MVTRTAAHVNFEAGEWNVGDLVRVGDLVLSVVVVPDVHPAVSSGEEEDSWSGRGEAPIGEVGSVVLGPDDGDLELVLPDLGAPVSDR